MTLAHPEPDRPRPADLAALAVVLWGLAASGCGPSSLEGEPCAAVGDLACEGLSPLRCDGIRWQRLGACHHRCVESDPVVHDEARLTASETWSCAAGPHLVTGVTLIEEGATLTVEGGAVVRFAAGARLDTTRRSRLVAQAEAEAEVLFTSDDETAGSYGAAQQGGINLLAVEADLEPSRLRGAVVERAVHGAGVFGLSPDHIAPVIERSVFRDNQIYGVLLRGCADGVEAPDYQSAGNRFLGNGEGTVSPCAP